MRKVKDGSWTASTIEMDALWPTSNSMPAARLVFFAAVHFLSI
jgi:hypothetical protein